MKLSKEGFERTTEESALELFYQGIRAEATREKYTRTLKMILCEYLKDLLDGSFEERANQIVRLGKDDPKYVRDLVLYISKGLKERTQLPKEHKDYLNPISFNNYFKPLKKLFDMNDVVISWKRIYSTFPEIDNVSNGRGWNRDEIQKMLNFAQGSGDRLIVLIAASSGIRSGGFNLDWEDVYPVYKIDNKLTFDITESQNAEIACAMLKIYKGSRESYPAFITPEAYYALQEYKKEWTHDVGREPKPNDPIFKKQGVFPVRASSASIKKRVERMIAKAELRIPLQKDKRRHEVPTMQGFRRFWNKVCKESLSRDSPLASFIKKEYMMGHAGMFKLDKNYFQTQVIELAEEYLNAVPNLTISNESRLRAEKIRLIKEKSEIENLKTDMQNLNDKVSKLNVEKLFRQVELDVRKTNSKKKADKLLEDIGNDFNNPKLMNILTLFEQFMNNFDTGIEDFLSSEDYKKLVENKFEIHEDSVN